MRILNIGSLNIDRVYEVQCFVSSGETISALNFSTHCGGKGLNQSVAIAKAGAQVYHAGQIGPDGHVLREVLQENGVHLDYLRTLSDSVSGHAIIQVEPEGQNCILVYSGANGQVTREYIDEVLLDFGENDILVLQNETSNVAYAMQQAKERGMKIVFNPSPTTPEMEDYPLDLLDVLILNEVEGEALTQEKSVHCMIDGLLSKYPNTDIVLTLGENGVLYRNTSCSESHGAYDVPVLDTTGAGDTFCGYYIACIARGLAPREAIELASRAAGIAVSRKGAAASIPHLEEVKQAKLTLK